MTDERLNRIAEDIANKSPWHPNTDNWTRIYQAARAGAVVALEQISERVPNNGEKSNGQHE